MTDKSQTKSSTCTALIIHPTFEKGILSAIIPSFQKERNILITFHNRKPKLYVIKQEGRGANDNVGLVSWPSGIYLAKYFATLQNNEVMFKNKNIIELGCGCSPLASIVLGELGANVIATDGFESVLNLTTENIYINWTQNMHENDSKMPQTSILEWGNRTTVNKLVKDMSFDYIFAADVIYYEKVHEKLIETLKLLSNNNNKKTIIFLAFQIRLHAFEVDFFKERLTRHGFHSKIIWTSMQPPIVKIAEIKLMDLK